MCNAIITKTCCRCNTVKQLAEFYKSKSRKDGHQYHCIDCGKAYKQSKKYRYKTKPEVQSRYDKKRKLRFPHKLKAKAAVMYAIRVGKIPRAKTLKCTCGKIAHDYHHESYAPEHYLNVIAVCQSCHQSIHNP